MLNKIFQPNKNKVIFSFLSGIIFIYIVLFEFVLPANKILPKPSILIESVPSLFQDYNFLSSFLFTFTAIYSVMLMSYFFIKQWNNLLISLAEIFPGLKELFVLGNYFIPLFLIFLFELWFGNSIWGEYFFIFILTMGTLKSTIINEIDSIKAEYILSARSLGLAEKEIVKKVVWKYVQPRVYDSIIKNHVVVWSLVIIYEFVCRTDGIGSILSLALKYNDLSLVIVLIAIIIVAILVMELLLINIKKKYFFWN
jgi:NitT/TauT family transport system permease protein